MSEQANAAVAAAMRVCAEVTLSWTNRPEDCLASRLLLVAADALESGRAEIVSTEGDSEAIDSLAIAMGSRIR